MAEKSLERMLKRDLVKEIEELTEGNSLLQESFAAATSALMAIQGDDIGWSPIGAQQQHDGFVITELHQLYVKMKQATKGNPLLKRGLSLRSSYIWGRGIDIVGDVPPRFQKKIDKNFDVLFSQGAFLGNERSLYNSGQHFLFYDKRTDEAYPVPLTEITNFASNPNRIADVWYYQRTWLPSDPATGLPTEEAQHVWYPVAETQEKSGKPLQKVIQNQLVDPHVVIIDVRVNRDDDECWGVPDVLASFPYAWAHSEYLKDGSRLLKALSTIAWKVVSKSKGNAAAGAVKMGGQRNAAATVSLTGDTDLVAMPKSGQVDLGDGDRIASYVAAGLGVSLTALLSTAGASGGSFGAEASLDLPAQNDTLSRQAIWENYYTRVLRVMGIKDGSVSVRFKSIAEDPAFRTLQGLNLALQNGAINQQEYRNAVLACLDVKPTTAELPKPTAFTGAKTIKPDYPVDAQLEIAGLQIASTEKLAKQNAATQVKVAAATPAAAPRTAQPADRQNPNSAQGVTGSSGKLSDGDNSLRDMSHKPGTGNSR